MASRVLHKQPSKSEIVVAGGPQLKSPARETHEVLSLFIQLLDCWPTAAGYHVGYWVQNDRICPAAFEGTSHTDERYSDTSTVGVGVVLVERFSTPRAQIDAGHVRNFV
jgi:hypothetical protein